MIVVAGLDIYIVEAILDLDKAIQFVKETFLAFSCSYTKKWNWIPHLFFHVTMIITQMDRWMDSIFNSSFFNP